MLHAWRRLLCDERVERQDAASTDAKIKQQKRNTEAKARQSATRRLMLSRRLYRNPKSSSRDSTGLVTQNHRPRPELLAAHEPQIEPLAQAGEQRRPVARQDGLHDKLVLIDQSQIRQGQRELHASHEQAFARLPLELLNGFPQVLSLAKISVATLDVGRRSSEPA